MVLPQTHGHLTEWKVISHEKDDCYKVKCIKGNKHWAENETEYWDLPDDILVEIIETDMTQIETDNQIGGKHYTELAIQPDEYAHKNGLSFMQGNAIKYITRYKFKNGKEDLLKAISVIQKLIEFEYAYCADDVNELIESVKYNYQQSPITGTKTNNNGK